MLEVSLNCGQGVKYAAMGVEERDCAAGDNCIGLELELRSPNKVRKHW